MNKLSDLAWKQCESIIEAIKHHPFNLQLADGKLAKQKFFYYLSQDYKYLKVFAKVLSIIVTKIPDKFVVDFTYFINEALTTEHQLIQDFFGDNVISMQLSPANFAYSNYLLSTSYDSSIEVAVASVTPCFWIYCYIANNIYKTASIKENFYQDWINTYASPKLNLVAQKIVNIFDILAEDASYEIRSDMMKAFEYSAIMEWHFLHDAYYEKSITDFL